VKQNLVVRAVLCALLFVAVPTFAFQMPVPFSADMATTSSHGNLNMTGKVYFSLPNMRIDMNNVSGAKSSGPMGGKMSIIVDTPAKKMYMLMTEQHMYMEFSTDQNSPMTQRMPNIQDMIKSGDMCAGHEDATCKKVGTESIDGRACDKWEMTEKSGKTETFWMDQKLHFPIKMVSGDMTTVYTNIKEGAQDASIFKVPAGFQKFDMGSMGGRPSH
jgi:hypothetical protein